MLSCVQDFIDALEKVGRPMGFGVGTPNAIQLENDRTDTFLRNIRSNISSSTQMVGGLQIELS